MFDLAKGFQKFETQHKDESRPGPQNSHSPAPVARLVPPHPLDSWFESNAKTTDAATAEERAKRDAGTLRLAYVLIGTALALYVGISWGMGWGPWR